MYQSTKTKVDTQNAMNKHEAKFRKAIEPVLTAFEGKKVARFDGSFTKQFRAAIVAAEPDIARFNWWAECLTAPSSLNNISDTARSSIIINLRLCTDCDSGVGCFYTMREYQIGRIDYLGILQLCTGDPPKRKHFSVLQVERAKAKLDKLRHEVYACESLLRRLDA